MRRLEKAVPALFFILALAFSWLLAIITPPFMVPDEGGHYLYARAISLGALLPRGFASGEVGALMPISESAFVELFQPWRQDASVRATQPMFEAARAIPKGGPVGEVSYGNQAIYAPVPYVAPVVALIAADLLDLDRLSTFYLGRLANALFYSIVVAIALSLIPAGRIALAAVLLLPMAAALAGSYSADAFVISVSTLACAVMFAADPDRPPGVRAIVLTAALVLMLASVKGPLIVLLIPLIGYAQRRSWVLAIVVAAAVLALFAAWQVGYVATPHQLTKHADANVLPAEQLAQLLADPLRVVAIALRTFDSMGRHFVNQVIGVLGWLDVPLPRLFYDLAIVGLGALLVASLFEDGAARSAGIRLLFAVAAVTGCALVFGALYLTYTEVGQLRVSGVQGRYFLPFAAPAVLAVAGVVRRPLPLIRTAGGVVLLALYLAAVPAAAAAIIGRYYLAL